MNSEILSSLYVINKNAKRFATEASQSYQTKNHTEADLQSSRKDALYSVKSAVLNQIHFQADVVEKHKIDNSYYYHFEFEDGDHTWQFHLPVEELSISSDRIEAERTLGEFTTDSRVQGMNRTLKTALRTINEELGINANNHLPPEATDAKWHFLY